MVTDKQKLGDFGERFVKQNFPCPKCKNKKTLKQLPPNFKCADIICDFCGYLAQVKTIMIGVRNPKKKSIDDSDDGLSKCGQIWVNELRLTEFDEKAEATAAGKITEALVNIGIPAVRGMKIGAQMADDAMRAARSNKYFKTTNPNLKKGVDKALELNARGKTNKFIAGALGGGLAEGVFVGDVEKVLSLIHISEPTRPY